MKKQGFSSERKEKIKKIRSGVEWVTLGILVLAFLIMFFDFHTYKAYDPKKTEMSDRGFIALAIPGVNRISTENSLSEDDLSGLLAKLKELGYVSVTQDDVRNYEENGEELPDRSVFLIFQDGKRDTAALSQALLEQYNFKATMLEPKEKDQKEQYLSDRDKKTLEDNSYWEMGMDEKLLESIDVVQTDSGWSVNHLLVDLEVLYGEDKIEKEEKLPKGMELKRGYSSAEDNVLVLTTDKKRRGKLCLNPEETYSNVHISTELCGSKNGTQKIGMRVNKKTGIYVQVTDKKLQLIERHGGVDDIIDEMNLESIEKSAAKGYELNIRLTDTGITIYVNNRIAVNNARVFITEPGQIVFSTVSKVDGVKSDDPIYDAKYKDLIVTADGKKIYDGSLKWHQSLRQTVKEWKRDFTAWVQQLD